MTKTWIVIKTVCVGIVIATIVFGLVGYWVGLRITTQKDLNQADQNFQQILENGKVQAPSGK